MRPMPPLKGWRLWDKAKCAFPAIYWGEILRPMLVKFQPDSKGRAVQLQNCKRLPDELCTKRKYGH